MKPAEITAALSGTQFLLGMVETRRAARNGDAKPDLSAPQELERIEQQVVHLEALEGQDEETRLQIEDLRERIEALRKEISHLDASLKTELAPPPHRPYFLDSHKKPFP